MSALDIPNELRWLFLDLNSFFASVEQNENPRLRHRPVAVLPLMTDSTCVIAASYEAKRLGIRTGTPVWEAKQKCPDIILVAGRHDKYVDYHHRILAEIDRHIPVSKICSIDEVACQLDQRERSREVAIALAHRIKAGLRANLGPCITCSIGIAPNRFLGKVGSDMQKPDGLVVLEPHLLPGPLFNLGLTDLCGIAKRTAQRLARGGICTVEQLWYADPKLVRRLWGGIGGERFWYELHGADLPEIATEKGSLSHSQMLAPECRPVPEARLVARRLTQKLGARLRRMKYVGQRFGLSMRMVNGERWAMEAHLPEPTDDNFLLLHVLEQLWQRAATDFPAAPPLKKVGVWLNAIIPSESVIPDLFEWTEARQRNHKHEVLSTVIDGLNRKLGKDTIVMGATAKRIAQYTGTKIAFDRIPDREEFYE